MLGRNGRLSSFINIVSDIFDFYNSLDLCDLNVISTDEILRIIRGNLSEERKNIIIDAFVKIDFNRKGFTEITYLKSIYNSSQHPEVKMGRKTENEISNLIKKEFSYENFVKINDNNIKVTLFADVHNNEIANNVIRRVNEYTNNLKYVTVKFDTK